MTEHSQALGAIILAGGDGLRLGSLTYRVTGQQIPKQFCPLLGNTTMLEATIRRGSLSFPSHAILTVVTRSHECFYRSALAAVSPETMLVQPSNRGTAAAIVYALLKHEEVNPAAIVAVFPSDHYVSDDGVFMRHVALAVRVVSCFPWTIVLLGARPSGADVDYGWIETAGPLEVAEQAIPVRRIRQFWEQPSLELVRRLLDMECLWNTFVLVASLPTLLEMMMKSLPALYARFAQARSETPSCLEDRGLTKVYDTLPSIDLSSSALARGAKRLAVLPLSGVGWSDLDEPGRAFAARECLGIHHKTTAISQSGTADEQPVTRLSSRAGRAAAFLPASRRQWWIKWLPN